MDLQPLHDQLEFSAQNLTRLTEVSGVLCYFLELQILCQVHVVVDKIYPLMVERSRLSKPREPLDGLFHAHHRNLLLQGQQESLSSEFLQDKVIHISQSNHGSDESSHLVL